MSLIVHGSGTSSINCTPVMTRSSADFPKSYKTAIRLASFSHLLTTDYVHLSHFLSFPRQLFSATWWQWWGWRAHWAAHWRTQKETAGNWKYGYELSLPGLGTNTGSFILLVHHNKPVLTLKTFKTKNRLSSHHKSLLIQICANNSTKN